MCHLNQQVQKKKDTDCQPNATYYPTVQSATAYQNSTLHSEVVLFMPIEAYSVQMKKCYLRMRLRCFFIIIYTIKGRLGRRS